MSQSHLHAVLQKTTLKSVLCGVKEIECFISYGHVYSDTVTTVAHSVHYLPQTCLKIPTPLIKNAVNNLSVSATVPRRTGTSSH